jgi:hypothetical protein
MSCALCRSRLFAIQITAYVFIFPVIVNAQQPVLGHHDDVVTFTKHTIVIERCFVEVRRRTRPPVCTTSTQI